MLQRHIGFCDITQKSQEFKGYLRKRPLKSMELRDVEDLQPSTLWLVAQSLNHYTTACPNSRD
jgi:hypothetical protein